ncbi:MAG: PIG-L family deacetylase [Acidobacteriota bacterium]
MSPHPDDVALSAPCAVRQATRQGEDVLIATLIGAEGSPRILEDRAAARLLGAELVAGGFADAPDRGPPSRPMSTLVFPDDPPEEDQLVALTDWLTELCEREHPHRLLLPLAVGGHVDHRHALVAGLLAARRCEVPVVELYEDRPYCFLRGATQLRLAELDLATSPAPGRLLRTGRALGFLRDGLGAGAAHVDASDLPRIGRGLLRLLTRRPGRLTGWEERWSVHPRTELGLVEAAAGCHRSQFPSVLGPLRDYLLGALLHARRLGQDDTLVERRYWLSPELVGALAARRAGLSPWQDTPASLEELQG